MSKIELQYKKIEWNRDKDDFTTFVVYDDYYLETYAEVDGSYSIAIKDKNVDGEKLFYKEEFPTYHLAEQFLEMILYCHGFEAEIEQLKRTDQEYRQFIVWLHHVLDLPNDVSWAGIKGTIEQLKAERDELKKDYDRLYIKNSNAQTQLIHIENETYPSQIKLKAENERLTKSRAAIAEEQIILRKELDEAERHWDKANRQANQLKSDLTAALAENERLDARCKNRNVERLKLEAERNNLRCCGNCGHIFEVSETYATKPATKETQCGEPAISKKVTVYGDDICDNWQPKERGE